MKRIQPTTSELKSLTKEQAENYKLHVSIHGKSARAKRQAFNDAKKYSPSQNAATVIFKNGEFIYV